MCGMSNYLNIGAVYIASRVKKTPTGCQNAKGLHRKVESNIKLQYKPDSV